MKKKANDPGAGHYESACRYEKAGRRTEAVEELRRAIESGFDERLARKNMGRIYRDMGKYDQALEELEKVLASDPRDNDINAEIGRVYELKGDRREAIREFETAIRKGNRSAGLYSDMGRVFRDIEEHESAVRSYKKAVSLDPGCPELYLELGRTYEREQDYDAAAGEYRKAAERGAEVSKMLGSVYYCQRKYSAALKELRKAAGIHKGESGVHADLARVYEHTREYGKAAGELVTAVKNAPEVPQYRRSLAAVYIKLGKYTLAMKELERASAIEPSDGETRFLLGRVRDSLGEYDESEKEFREAIRLGFDNGKIRHELGEVCCKKGAYEEAAAEFRKELEFDPENKKTHALLGRLYSVLGKKDLARSEYEKAGGEGYFKKYLGAHDIRVFYKQTVKNMEFSDKKAGEECRRELARMKKNIKGSLSGWADYLYLGGLYRGMGEKDSALEAFRAAKTAGDYEGTEFIDNKILNEIEITQGKLKLKSLPRILYVTLTNKCNIKCIMCPGRKRSGWDIPGHTVDDITGLMPYLQEVNWIGGEVFLSKYFRDLYVKAAGYGNLTQQINTNGQLIDAGWARDLARKKVVLSYSIHGLNAETYEAIMRGASFKKLIKNIGIVNKYKTEANENIHNPGDRMRTVIHFLVMKSNYPDLSRIVDFADENGFDEIQVFPITEVLGAENIYFNMDRSALEGVQKMMAGVMKDGATRGISVYNAIPEVKERPGKPACAAEEVPEPDRSSGTDPAGLMCYLPWQCVFINDSLEVQPHGPCFETAGSVKNESLGEIWNSEKMQAYRRKIVNNDFSWCDFKCVTGAIRRSLKRP